MQIADVLPQLGIFPLRRFADAWSVAAIKSDKRDTFEMAIVGARDRINSLEAVRQRLTAFERDLDYANRANAEMALRMILDQPGYVVGDEADFIKLVVERDAAFVAYAMASTSLRHLDRRTVDVYQSVVEVAWEDRVTFDEYQLIKRLQAKLGICRRDHLVLETRIRGRSPLTSQDISEALKSLNYQGFICQFKHQGRTQIVIPEEIASHLRTIYGMVLQSGAYRNLATKLPTAAIRKALEDAGQPAVSSRKDWLIERLMDGDVSPAVVLECLDDKALDELFQNFPHEKRPTMRAVKIRHLLSHFERFAAKAPEPKPEDPDKTYFDNVVELGSRQYEVLRSANVIHRDQNVDRFFERGVRYAFRTFFGHPSLEFTGSAHADGGVVARNGRMALWDCKSAIGPYALTEAKCAQFLQYVARESPMVVSPFLIFSGSFTDDSSARALTLKANCPPGTEIGLLTASDLKWLAERWQKEYPDKRLPLDVLAHSGRLDRETLEFRLKAFASKAEDKE
jgi:hypothetical protein